MKERERAVRAARSYIHNRALKPKVEARLARATARLESYLLRQGCESLCLGRYKVERVNGELVVSELPPEGWEQLEMSGLGADADLNTRSRSPRRADSRPPQEHG